MSRYRFTQLSKKLAYTIVFVKEMSPKNEITPIVIIHKSENITYEPVFEV
jgi:hypothetical protein